jgi:LmbE family N-acetylglucosaminyl deacetylase
MVSGKKTIEVNFAIVFASLVLLANATAASALPRLPEDRGSAALAQSLRKLQTTGRVVYMIAHPDDEDGGTVTMLTRGKGYKVTFLALSRGEAAGDAVSSDAGPPLGIRRTLEMMRSTDYYGARLRMSRFLDFGLSRTLAKTLRYWNEEDALRDMVRFIRQERPHVVLSRWQGNSGDRLGNHEIDGLVARRAFDAAGDPKRFPEQIAEGLTPWQPLKFYNDNRTENDEWTVKIDSGVYDPLLGRTYGDIANEGLGQQISQAAAGPILPVGWPSVSYYKLVASKVGIPDKETDFFERIDVSLGKYQELEKYIRRATKDFDAQHPDTCVPHLSEALKEVRRLRRSDVKNFDLEVKERQLETALSQALGLDFEALVEPARPGRTSGEYKAIRTPLAFVPGDSFRVITSFHLGDGATVNVRQLRLRGPAGWKITELPPNRFEVSVPQDASFTSAFWVRNSIHDGFYRITRPELLGEPITPDPLQAELTYSVNGVEVITRSNVETSSIGTTGTQQRHAIAIAPPISVRFHPESIALPLGRPRQRVVCSLRNYVNGQHDGTVHLELPQGWRSEPESAPFTFQKQDQEADVVFELVPPSDAQGSEYRIQAIVESKGKSYQNSFVPVTEPGLDTVYMENPATLLVRPIDVVVPNVRVGYVIGSGDEVPDSLRLLGIYVDVLDSTALAQSDLSQYGTIVLGVRAYLAREDLRAYNWRLLEYVRLGGVLIAQYNTEEFDESYGPYPYAAAGAAQDVTEEDSQIEVLQPNHPVLNEPNKIGPQDFQGWLEKRGLRFLASWDDRYIPILSTHDKGQKPQAGGLLVARYGKGLWLYNGYSLYRQLAFAVPGGVRLFANLIQLGSANSSWRDSRQTELLRLSSEHLIKGLSLRPPSKP